MRNTNRTKEEEEEEEEEEPTRVFLIIIIIFCLLRFGFGLANSSVQWSNGPMVYDPIKKSTLLKTREITREREGDSFFF